MEKEEEGGGRKGNFFPTGILFDSHCHLNLVLRYFVNANQHNLTNLASAFIKGD